VRDQIAGKKLGGADYIGVHRAAHALGIRSNCTMLYGHVETVDDRMEHLQMLRDLQDETGGFLAYIPLAYHPDDNRLGKQLGREGTATTMADDLKMLAVGRLFLDTHAHVKSHWIMVSPAVSQVALHFGVNDLEGTVVREKIYHAVGARRRRRCRSTRSSGSYAGRGRCRPSATRSTACSARSATPKRRPPAPRSPGRPDVSAQSGPRRRAARATAAACASAASRTSTATRSTAPWTAASFRSTRSSSTASRRRSTAGWPRVRWT
jgi:hypothetical protein